LGWVSLGVKETAGGVADGLARLRGAGGLIGFFRGARGLAGVSGFFFARLAGGFFVMTMSVEMPLKLGVEVFSGGADDGTTEQVSSAVALLQFQFPLDQ
jgi:hypothetical protein